MTRTETLARRLYEDTFLATRVLDWTQLPEELRAVYQERAEAYLALTDISVRQALFTGYADDAPVVENATHERYRLTHTIFAGKATHVQEVETEAELRDLLDQCKRFDRQVLKVERIRVSVEVAGIEYAPAYVAATN